MGINAWWTGDSRERFWMEITNRDVVGENLIAPQRNDAGLIEWSYETLRHVRPGDIVLHWRKHPEPALTGYSHCSGGAYASALEWQSRGSYGRTRPPTGEEDAWEVTLEGYRPLASPLTLDRIRALDIELREVRAGLLATYGNSPLYFPFAISGLRPIRAAQAYLAKFPAALVDAIPELAELAQVAVDDATVEEPPPPRSKSGKAGSGYGRQPDAKRRKAVEDYAVSVVRSHYEDQGFRTEDVGARESWDVTATKGREVIHVEVKGSTIDRLAIDITEGEVRHAEDHETVLVVLDRIQIDDALNCSGGRWRLWSSWVPDRLQLVPTAYRHALPPGAIEK